MTQHFTRATVSAALWCLKCNRETQHRIDDGRKGPCLECIARLEKKHNDAAPKPEKQGDLFVIVEEGAEATRSSVLPCESCTTTPVVTHSIQRVKDTIWKDSYGGHVIPVAAFSEHGKKRLMRDLMRPESGKRLRS